MMLEHEVPKTHVELLARCKATPREGGKGLFYSRIYAEFDDILLDYDCIQGKFEVVPHPMQNALH